MISIIIPVLNEEDNVFKLHKEIVNICEKNCYKYEIIFINDGSTDKTLENLKTLKPIKIINFRKNFGQTFALDAGIKQAKGDYLITMDGDGQNDPHDIPKLIKKLESENLDVVSGWRKKRKDPILKKFFSRCAYLVRKALLNDWIHDSGCTFKIYRKECFINLDLVGEMHRFIPALLMMKGFKVDEVKVNHRKREFGKTKYNWTRGVKGNLDILSLWFWKKFAKRPLHLFGTVGIIITFTSVLAGFWAMYKKLFCHIDLSDTALTNLALFGFLTGIQFFVFGLIADMLSKTYYSSTKDTFYDIKEIIEK